MPGASFSYVLGQLPWNRHCLSSDAAATYGIAGVLHFSPETSRDKNCAGLFWQLSWDEWNLISPLMSLSKKRSLISAAEYLAALITIETFAEYCKEKITILGIDNTSAKFWLDSARCPKAPYDRCAQSTHMFMIKQRMKIRTQWVSSVDNILADHCSRKYLSKSRKGHHIISGVHLLKVSPKWQNVLRFCKH